MKSAVIQFPGTNRERDLLAALAQTGGAAQLVWHRETELPPADVIWLPGGFSYGDYLRCGAMAAHSPIMRAVIEAARRGARVVGICNGFQMLLETRLLPGALMMNASLKFICDWVHLRCEPAAAALDAEALPTGAVLRIPIAHHEGNYRADAEVLARLEGEGRVLFRYAAADGTADGAAEAAANPNGSAAGIAGIASEDGRIMGLMPHPENAIEDALGGTDGKRFFAAIARSVAA